MVPWPGRMSRPISAPARATAAATRKAVCIPLANAAWLMPVITGATWGGVLLVTGAAPTETALWTAACWAPVSAGRRRWP